jgi:hypothetical protein
MKMCHIPAVCMNVSQCLGFDIEASVMSEIEYPVMCVPVSTHSGRGCSFSKVTAAVAVTVFCRCIALISSSAPSFQTVYPPSVPVSIIPYLNHMISSAQTSLTHVRVTHLNPSSATMITTSCAGNPARGVNKKCLAPGPNLCCRTWCRGGNPRCLVHWYPKNRTCCSTESAII